MGSRNIKKIKGNDYLYYIVSEKGKKHAIYCGLVGEPKTEERVLKLELEQLKKQKKHISQKVVEIESKMKLI